MKRIAVTMGDPAGVGPELCLRLLAAKEITAECAPIIFGDAEVLEAAAQATGVPVAAPVNTSAPLEVAMVDDP